MALDLSGLHRAVNSLDVAKRLVVALEARND